MTHLEKYNDIILNSLSQNRNKLKKSDQNYVYYENHHITPKCLGGGNEKDNLVLLTAQEHFIAHKLLTKIYPDNRKIACAFFRMCHDNKNRKISSTDYKYAKELLSMIGHTKETKKKISKSLSGKFQSKESCIKRSNTCKEKNLHKGDKNPMYGKSGTMLGKFHSMESKQKMKKPYGSR